MTSERPTQELIENKVRIRVINEQDLNAHIEDIATAVADITSDGFGPDKVTNVERIKNRLLREPHVLLAEHQGVPIGIQFQTVHETDNDCFVYYSRVVCKKYQGYGIARQLLDQAIQQYKPSVVGARSQNPAEILSYIRVMKRLGVQQVFPFDGGDGDTNPMTETSNEFLRILDFTSITDPNTGVIRGAYPEGRLGDYTIDMAHQDIADIEKYMQQVGLSRENGDALFYCARLPYEVSLSK